MGTEATKELPTNESLVQCCECGHHETRRSGLGTFAWLECTRCGGALEILTINGESTKE